MGSRSVLRLLAITSLLYGCQPLPLSMDYEPREALQIMKLVAASYAADADPCLVSINRDDNSDWTKLLHKVTPCGTHLRDNCTMLIVKSDKRRQLLIGYRGTDSLRQLSDELIYTFKPEATFLGGRVHRYFFDVFWNTWPPLESILQNSRYDSYSVIYSGMSLGGAMASLAAAHTVKNAFRNASEVALRTFGQPRVGDSDYARNFDNLVPNSYRVVNKADIVAHAPPCAPNKLHGCSNLSKRHYYHHGTEVWYPKGCHNDGLYKVCNGSSEDPTCSDSLKSYTIFDHVGGYFLNAGDFAEADCSNDFPTVGDVIPPNAEGSLV